MSTMEHVLKGTGKSRRSRAGCSSCRRQRIKCDEDYPRCQQCKKRNRLCNLAEARFRNYAPPGDSHDAALSPNVPTDGATRGDMDDVASVSHPTQRRFQMLVDLAGSELSPPQSRPNREDETREAASSIASRPSANDSFRSGFSARDRRAWSDASLPYPRGFRTRPWSAGHSAAPHSEFAVTDSPGGPSILESRASWVPRTLETAGQGTLNQLPLPQDSSLPHELHENTYVRRDSVATTVTQLAPICGTSRSRQSDVSIRYGVDTTEERAFLLRYFGARPGRWMDLFDLDLFYSRDVPVLALHSPILMFSACAFAARQLSMTSGQPLPDLCRSYNEHRDSAIMRQRDWTWIAESYYDAAISLLRQHTSDVAAQDSGPILSDSDELQYAEPVRQAGHLGQVGFVGAKLRDQVVAAVIILANYEFLKGVAPNWSDHLDGTRSFLRLCDEAGFLAFGPTSPLSGGSSGPPRLLRAAFWNFARQDMLSALIHRQPTRLEIEDIAMWRRMGINLGDDGRLNSETALPATQHWTDRIDMVSNTMIWLLARLVNFINILPTPDEEADDLTVDISFESSDRTQDMLENWLSLRQEFDVWYSARPSLFKPCSQVALTTRSHGRTNSTTSASPSNSASCHCKLRALIDHETWYSESMCASTMQSYHMAQVFLLLHKPPNVSVRRLYRALGLSHTPSRPSVPDTLSDFVLMRDMLNFHSVEICAIALSRPDEASRIHMLQPLYMAGRCLSDMADRRIVVRLIDGIENELGWHAKYRVDALLGEWNLTRDMLDCSCLPR